MQYASEESWQREETKFMPARRAAAGHQDWKETFELILTHSAVLLGAAHPIAGVGSRAATFMCV